MVNKIKGEAQLKLFCFLCGKGPCRQEMKLGKRSVNCIKGEIHIFSGSSILCWLQYVTAHLRVRFQLSEVNRLL